MQRLSLPLDRIQAEYDVVVIGSGYGGGIAASRMARAGRKVCVLERGKEFQLGEFPNKLFEAAAEMQSHLPGGLHLGSSSGLFDFHFNEDIHCMVGCGLGGTSLINANVSLQADPRVFEDECWPQALREDLDGGFARGIQRAREMLKPNPYPDDLPEPKKLKAMGICAPAMGAESVRAPLNVTFHELPDGRNHVGVAQPPCNQCGDCVSGCNEGSKNTTTMNYLPDARNHGAEIFTHADVRHIEREDEHWVVHFQSVDQGREAFGNTATMHVRADIVMLAAGTLGSTEILLRSKAEGLSLSDRLGMGFTGNGDIVSFAYNGDVPINAVGAGTNEPDEDAPVGPCITGTLDMRDTEELDEGILMEEGAIPGAIAALMPAGLYAASQLGEDMDSGFIDALKEKAREIESAVRGPYHGALEHTQTFLTMTHDDAGGVMELDDDQLVIRWPGVGTQPFNYRAKARAMEAAKALGATYTPNPIWNRLTDHSLITVHPLGGCCMGESAEQGVVDQRGEVFSGNSGSNTHAGLFVCDGSVMPRSLGVNPLLTISAFAERSCALIAEQHGWPIDYQLPSVPPESHSKDVLGIRFTETMKGYFSSQVKGDDYQAAAEQGEAEGSPFQFVLTITSHDMEAMLSEPTHQARMIGTVTAPVLSAQPLQVTDGIFNLFTDDPQQPDTKNMRYRMRMSSEEGKRFYFEGFKVIRDGDGFDLWADSTTLYITVYEGDNAEGSLLGRGILRISIEDFVRQLTTMQVLNAGGALEHVGALARFGRFFAGELYDTYIGG